MFTADYPYETMEEAVGWFDSSLLSRNDAPKIGRSIARRLLSRMTWPVAAVDNGPGALSQLVTRAATPSR